MYTQCPQCQTVFRVTAAMLKAASGRVRCGRCSHVFSALTFLIEREDAAPAGDTVSPGDAPNAGSSAAAPQRQRTASPPSTTPPRTTHEAAPVPADPAQLESADIPESMLEFNAEDLSKVFVVAPAPRLVARPGAGAPTPQPVSASDEDTAEHEILDIELEGEDSGEFITLEGDSVVLGEGDPSVSAEYFIGSSEEAAAAADTADPNPEWHRHESIEVAYSHTPAQTASGTGLQSASAPTQTPKIVRTTEAIDAEVQREIEAAFATDPTTRAEFTLPSGKRIEIGRSPPPLAVDGYNDIAPGDELHSANQRRRQVALTWSVASGALALTLIMQIMHHNRRALVRSPLVGSALSSVYAALGSELTPEWNVQAYELRQFGAAADTGVEGTLRVRASLLNGAEHAQPYPVLRLTLQDRFGGQVGLRDLEPREYLRAAPARNALIGAGQRIDADIAIVDPGKDAVGFEIDVCLHAAPRRLTCANDAPRVSG